jgi:hypothetical protein
MMRKTFLWCLLLILVACLSAVYAFGGKEDDASPAPVTFIKSLEFESVTRLALESKDDPTVRLKDSEKERKIPVRLTQRAYRFRGMKIVDSTPTSFEPSGGLFCYELRSENTDHLFAWSFWSTSACGCFRLLDDARTGSHLAFVQGGDVFIAPVDGLRDSAAELKDFEMDGWRLPTDFIHVPVADLIARGEFLGVNALYGDDIRIGSVDISGKRTSVGLSSRRTKKECLLEYDGKKWKRK